MTDRPPVSGEPRTRWTLSGPIRLVPDPQSGGIHIEYEAEASTGADAPPTMYERGFENAVHPERHVHIDGCGHHGEGVEPEFLRGHRAGRARLRAKQQEGAEPMTTTERPTTEAGRLRRQVIHLGGRLDGFEHTLIEQSSKASDPTDIRWDCMCGYAGSPERVERHWDAMLVEYEASLPAEPTAPTLDDFARWMEDKGHDPTIVDDYDGPTIECANRKCVAGSYDWTTTHVHDFRARLAAEPDGEGT